MSKFRNLVSASAFLLGVSCPIVVPLSFASPKNTASVGYIHYLDKSKQFSFEKPAPVPPGLKITWQAISLTNLPGDRSISGQCADAAKHLASNELPAPHVSYRASGKDWFVLSGTSNQNIFYQRTKIGKSLRATILLIYPAQLKASLNEVAAHVANSMQLVESSGSKLLTETEAIEKVSRLPAVKQWMFTLQHAKGSGKPAFDADKNGHIWTVHVFESLSDHNATFGWYDVDAQSGKIQEK